MLWWSAASMPSGQILYLMMFVGKCSCTSHVLQYSSSRSYEHSRSLQSSLCPGVVTVLICSFFVAAWLFVYINLENGGKNIHVFTNRQIFSYLFCIFHQFCSKKIGYNKEKIKSSNPVSLTFFAAKILSLNSEPARFMGMILAAHFPSIGLAIPDQKPSSS